MEREPETRTRIVEELPERAPLVAPRGAASGHVAASEAPTDRERSVRTLLVAWAIYWVGLLAVQLWPAVVQWWTVRRQEHGTITISVGGELSTVLAWITLPPLLMAIVWLVATRRRSS